MSASALEGGLVFAREPSSIVPVTTVAAKLIAVALELFKEGPGPVAGLSDGGAFAPAVRAFGAHGPAIQYAPVPLHGMDLISALSVGHGIKCNA